MTKIRGLFEAKGGITGLFIGGIAGYKFGTDAVEYANILGENIDTIGYAIKEHPILTRVITIVGSAGICGEAGRFAELIDGPLGTDVPSDSERLKSIEKKLRIEN